MSLIADALQAAQGEKVRRADEHAPARRASAAALLGTSPPNRGGRARIASEGLSRSVVYALLGLGCAVGVAAAVVLSTPVRADGVPRERSAPAPRRVPTGVATNGMLPTGSVRPPVDAGIALPAASGMDAGPVPAVETEPARAVSPPAARTGDTAPAPRAAAPREEEDSRGSPAPVEPDRSDRVRMTIQPAHERPSGFQEAAAAQRRRDYPAAVQLYERVLQQDPNNAEALYNLGTVLQTMGELARARDSYRRALSADRSFAAAWSNLAVVLSALGDSEQAQVALTEATRLDPRNLGAKVNLANQYLSRGGAEEAATLLEDVLRVDPTMAEAHYALGRALETKREPAAAVRHYHQFLQHSAGRFPQLEEPVRQRIRQLAGDV